MEVITKERFDSLLQGRELKHVLKLEWGSDKSYYLPKMLYLEDPIDGSLGIWFPELTVYMFLGRLPEKLEMSLESWTLDHLSRNTKDYIINEYTRFENVRALSVLDKSMEGQWLAKNKRTGEEISFSIYIKNHSWSINNSSYLCYPSKTTLPGHALWIKEYDKFLTTLLLDGGFKIVKKENKSGNSKSEPDIDGL